MQYLGDFAEDETVYIPFNTFSSDDPQASVTITNLANADIHVHKDGGTTEIATDGATVAINFDGITGNHLITIDTSVHADYSIGSDYIVRIEGTTVDGGTINAFVGSFSIENRFMRGTDSANTVVPPTVAQMNARTLVAADYFDPAVDAVANVTLVATTTTNTDMRGTDNAATETKQDIIDTNVDAILVDTNELQQTLALTYNIVNSLGITKNAAFSNYMFTMVLSSDHYTAATGLTVTGERSIDGGAFVAVSGAITEISDGVYQFDALAADTNGDVITWRFSSATADDTIEHFETRV